MAGNNEAAVAAWEGGKCSQGEKRKSQDNGQDSANSPRGDVGAVIDLSGQGLQKLGPSLPCPADTHTLILDKNQIIKLEHLEKFKYLKQLSVANNRLVRMMGVAKLTCLRVLNLPHNSIGYVEGLRDLGHLEWLNLAGNNLKTIDQINSCTSLRHLDLSDNNLSQTGDLSKLTNLKTLLLHGNNITSLRTASVCLPHNLTIISLAENEIRDLNEISFLTSLLELEQLSIMNNPCVMDTPSLPGFDYRPYVVSWCLSLKVLDGYVVSQKESLKAEWLYSQGKGRSYRPGQHVHLVQYLASVCPLTSTAGLQTTEDAKLEKILNKQRYHQRQLMHQCSKKTKTLLPNTGRDLTFSSQYQSMSHGQHSTIENESVRLESWIATNASGDRPHTVRNFIPNGGHTVRSHPNDLYLEDIQTDEDKLNCSLLSSESTFMPVASGLSPVSPSGDDCMSGINSEQHTNILDFVKNLEGGDGKQDSASRDTVEKKPEEQRQCELLPIVSPANSFKNDIPRFSNCPGCCLVSAEGVQVNTPTTVEKKLQNIICSKESSGELSDCRVEDSYELSVPMEEASDWLSQRNKAAIKLQACWRGFHTRNYHPKAQKVRYEIRLSRMQEHILFLRAQVSKLQKENEEERIQRMVQEAAVKLLWSNVQSLQHWQLSVNQRLDGTSQPSVRMTSSCPSHWSVHSSSPSSETTCNHACCSEIKDEHSSSDMPDSGFHSIFADQTDSKDRISFSSRTVAGSRESGHSDDNVNHCDTADPDSLLGMQQKDNGECPSDSSNSDQDSSLLQQYLKTVEQLAEGDDVTSCSDQTEDSRVHASDLQEI
ncbi:centrosomal protein of 97 kDa [Lissotriton helveticus]